jgi:3-hydroxy-3-methylglutaryl CoA synthase
MSRFRVVRPCRSAVLAALMLAGIGGMPVQAATYSGADAMSFEMWCQEMQSYPAERCKARNTEDVKEYERYRTTVEQYQKTRTEQQKRDQQIKDTLNRDPTDQRR